MPSKLAPFKTIIADFVAKKLPETISRKYAIPLTEPKIISLVGPRRVGKTFILFDIINQLRNDIPRDRMVYINFEDDRLFPLQLSEMDDLLKAYYELYPDNKNEKVYFFFDEVQEVEHWEKFIRRIWDQENCAIFLTGSSSRLLSRELATSLRGRTLPFEIYPLSFSEFLRFREITPDTNSSGGQARLKNELRRYLFQGGFPELVFVDESLHRRLIAEYLDIMLYKDLTERFGIKNISLMKYLLKYLLGNVGGLVTKNKIYKDLKSQGFAIGRNTIYEYSGYLEEAFIVFFVERHSRSARQQAVNPNKLYSVDPAFKYAMSTSADEGRILENQVFIELRRRGKSVNYFAGKKETDFITDDRQLINVSLDLSSPDTRQREEAGLQESMDFFSSKHSLLISIDMETTWETKGKTIEVIPFWKWALHEDV